MEDIRFSNITLPAYVLTTGEENTVAAILKQFEDKPEFELTILPLDNERYPPISYWEILRNCIRQAISNDDDVIIICDDEHSFTDKYERDIFIQHILDAHTQGCELLSGGIEEADQVVQVARSRFWINHFTSSPFLVLYRKVFEKILAEPYHGIEPPEAVLSEIATNKILIYPFISAPRHPDTVVLKYAGTESFLKKVIEVHNLYSKTIMD
jgi:hypothetical protein